ncbi:MAG: hypothetical protein HY791_03810 [Deltaproteobacteria bacterium]|nr:hypothetical protein [Deltaproteobacteria bacterium]
MSASRVFRWVALGWILSSSATVAAGVPDFCYLLNDHDDDGYVYGRTGAVCPRDDCDDEDASIHPGAADACGDGVDQDCDGADAPCPGTDDDADGYRAASAGGDDCDDHDRAIHPGAPEVACDGLDNDCLGGDAACVADEDLDGYGARPQGTDCDDHAANVHPHALELCGDGVDQDCADGDPPCVEDADGDGFRNSAMGGDDCDDFDRAAHPDATETCGDGRDQDCDGQDAVCATPVSDADRDGHGRIDLGGDDCNDEQAAIHPDAAETCGDTIDQNCDGRDLSCSAESGDGDGDGFPSVEAGGSDCNDEDAATHPGAVEICGDGRDQDCDGADATPGTPACEGSATDPRFEAARGRVLKEKVEEKPFSCTSGGETNAFVLLVGLAFSLARRRR